MSTTDLLEEMLDSSSENENIQSAKSVKVSQKVDPGSVIKAKKNLSEKQKEALKRGREIVAEKKAKQKAEKEKFQQLTAKLQSEKDELRAKRKLALQKLIDEAMAEKEKIAKAVEPKRHRKKLTKIAEASNKSTSSDDESDDDDESVTSGSSVSEEDIDSPKRKRKKTLNKESKPTLNSSMLPHNLIRFG